MTTEKDLEIAEEEIMIATRRLSELYKIMRETPEYKAIVEQKEKVGKANLKLHRLMQEQL